MFLLNIGNVNRCDFKNGIVLFRIYENIYIYSILKFFSDSVDVEFYN